MKKNNQEQSDNEIRLDKWLWAARFYKTRSIAKAMIEGGKEPKLAKRWKLGQRSSCAKAMKKKK